ncbi:leucine-rich repeat receptor protein kinase HPCA1-like isoform X4 [Silene latifolia]|uniref:leucine-rich repeat receptor protein kinase HPCA1-like isoform X4 n=1 Tax=Silene latifolia TaxID=37657 RepID=UPI003D76D3E4
MVIRLVIFLAFLYIRVGDAVSPTDNQDYAALTVLTKHWENLPLSWTGGDPCGNEWVGITCRSSRIISIKLSSVGLTGQLSGDLVSLSELQTLDLSYNIGLTGSLPPNIGQLAKLTILILIGCGFSGTIPDSIGSLQQLTDLSLNSNKFSGQVPASIGKLKELYWLDLSDNKLSGSIPVSDGTNPGLDLLVNAKHFHFGINQLSGTIPDRLFSSDMTLIHLLFDNNNFTGMIPSTLGLVQTLQAVRLDRNKLGGHIPSNLKDLTDVNELVLSNNDFSGPVPDLTGMNNLNYVDMSNNSFAAANVSLWLTSLESLTTVLADNKVCNFSGVNLSYCHAQQDRGSSYSTPVSCPALQCESGQKPSPKCKCGYPYTGTWTFRAPSFSAFGNPNYFKSLQQSLEESLVSLNLPVDSVLLSDVVMDAFGYPKMRVAIFPAGQVLFNTTGVISLGFVFSNQIYQPSKGFGPYVFIADSYPYFGKNNGSRIGVIVGAVVGSSVLFLLLCAGGYAYHRKKIADKAKQQANANSFVSWDSQQTGDGIPQLKAARFFSVEELQKCTNNFSEENIIGAGGYGKVYKGIFADRQMIAIKRSQAGSMQGSREFRNEIELLSRVHHKNLVKLLGFCYDQGEQILVYEFIPNGTLMDALLGTSGIQLDWIRRLMITLGAARGLQYLHELADPPIIHRDIKSTNILLDERLIAKVADFGLSKLFGDTEEKGYVTTQVKGTLGYLDPEYYMTNQVTEKSDVYSFGVVMLEMITARIPIQKGKYIVKEIKTAIDRTKDLYSLQELIDPILLSSATPLVGLEKFVDLALNCVQDSGVDRPTMGELVQEFENIVKLAGMNPSAESGPLSCTYDGASGGDAWNTSTDDSLLRHSGSTPLIRTESRAAAFIEKFRITGHIS